MAAVTVEVQVAVPYCIVAVTKVVYCIVAVAVAVTVTVEVLPVLLTPIIHH